jgi:hypothetical protein
MRNGMASPNIRIQQTRHSDEGSEVMESLREALPAKPVWW